MNKKQREYWLRKKSHFGQLFCIKCTTRLYWYDNPKAIVEHIDNNSSNNHPSNIQIYCSSCNSKKNPRGKSKSQSYIPPKRMTQSEAVNQRAEKPWYEWVKSKIKFYDPDGFSIDEAISSGAFLFDVSVDTIRYRWLDKFTSSASPIKVVHGTLFFKSGTDPNEEY